MTVTARVELLAVDGRMLAFRVEAFDEREKNGEGIRARLSGHVQRDPE